MPVSYVLLLSTDHGSVRRMASFLSRQILHLAAYTLYILFYCTVYIFIFFIIAGVNRSSQQSVQ